MENYSIEQIGDHLLSDKKFVHRLRTFLINEPLSSQSNQIPLEKVIEEVRELLHELIQHQLEVELREIIEDNNRILKQIKSSMSVQFGQKHRDVSADISFTQVHKLMNQEKKKFLLEEPTDANLEKSFSAFVELKVESIEDKMTNIDKRLKNMEQKYETNLRSIWNVLSVTESAVFEHIKQYKETLKKQQIKKKEQGTPSNKLFNFFG